jgi:hypothetical protein
MQGLPEESLVGRAMLVADSVARQADRVTAVPPRNRAQDARVTAGSDPLFADFVLWTNRR